MMDKAKAQELYDWLTGTEHVVVSFNPTADVAISRRLYDALLRNLLRTIDAPPSDDELAVALQRMRNVATQPPVNGLFYRISIDLAHDVITLLTALKTGAVDEDDDTDTTTD
jgi:hypothetical protein